MRRTFTAKAVTTASILGFGALAVGTLIGIGIPLAVIQLVRTRCG